MWARARARREGNPCRGSGLAEVVRNWESKEDIPANWQFSKGGHNQSRARKVSTSRRKYSHIRWPGIRCQSPVGERRVSVCGVGLLEAAESSAVMRNQILGWERYSIVEEVAMDRKKLVTYTEVDEIKNYIKLKGNHLSHCLRRGL